MPMTLWSDIVGYTCLWCGKWATHFYSGPYDPICCACHYGEPGGKDEGEYMAQQAIEMNTRFQKGLPLEDEEPLELDLDEQWGGKVEYTAELEYTAEQAYELWIQSKKKGY
jgi:hypothetical protein